MSCAYFVGTMDIESELLATNFFIIKLRKIFSDKNYKYFEYYSCIFKSLLLLFC